MLKIFESSLLLRKLSARLVTLIRNNKTIKTKLKKLGVNGGDVWAANKAEEQYKELYEKYTVNFESLIKGEKQRVGLIALQDDEVNDYFKKSCQELNLGYDIFDPCDETFIEKIKNSSIQRFIVRPSHKTQLVRQMFLEKIDILVNELGKDIYPTIKEQKIYEAKRTLAYFLQANDIPHPRTWVFYTKNQALEFVEDAEFPLVFKTHNGAGASGVEIVKTKRQAISLIKTIFDSYYLNKSITDFRDIDYGYILFQEFIEGAREHRIIKIGESWMGHEKALNGTSEFMSGSGINLWTRPTNEILDFCREIAEKHNFTTMCFDIFEDKHGNFYVNELQTWFGSYNPSQMYIDGTPGRLVYIDNQYLFEEGLFNHNQSLALRVVDMLGFEGEKIC